MKYFIDMSMSKKHELKDDLKQDNTTMPNGSVCYMYIVVGVLTCIGLSALICGSVFIAEFGKFENELEDLPGETNPGETLDADLYLGAIYVLLCAGILQFLSSGLGLFGTLTRNSFMLVLFIAFSSVNHTMLFTSGTLGAVYSGDVNTTEYDNQIQAKYGEDGYGNLTENWDTVQTEWCCCGSYNVSSYTGSDYNLKTGNPFPPSCCKDWGEVNHNYTACRRANDIHHTGCTELIKDTIEGDRESVMIGSFVLGSFGVIAIILAILLKGKLQPDSVVN